MNWSETETELLFCLEVHYCSDLIFGRQDAPSFLSQELPFVTTKFLINFVN